MKRIVICCDGTWNRPDRGKPTNVEKMAAAIAQEDGDGVQQIVYYDEGVGHDSLLPRLAAGMFGIGLEENIRSAYQFLVVNFRPGDEIYFFGFSRGAYTVRSLAGLIRKCGLLRDERLFQAREAYRLYRRWVEDPDKDQALIDFKAQNSWPEDAVKVRLLGVWDTVGSLGIPGHLRWASWLTRRKVEFHDVRLSSRIVQNAAQALAIDEHRRAYEPAVWWRTRKPTQGFEQMWFPGAHSDVGGGCEPNGTPCIGDVAFEWMRSKAVDLAFDQAYLAENIHPDPNAAIHNSFGFPFNLMQLGRRHLRPIGVRPPDEHLADELKRTPACTAESAADTACLEWPQSVHESALARFGNPAMNYRPKNLAAYLQNAPQEAEPHLEPVG